MSLTDTHNLVQPHLTLNTRVRFGPWWRLMPNQVKLPHCVPHNKKELLGQIFIIKQDKLDYNVRSLIPRFPAAEETQLTLMRKPGGC